MSKETWKPKSGRFLITSYGKVVEGNPVDSSSMAGIERETRELAEKAASKIMYFKRLLAYVDEFDQVPEEERNCNIYLKNGLWRWDVKYSESPWQICMSSTCAKLLCKKLNSGDVVLWPIKNY